MSPPLRAVLAGLLLATSVVTSACSGLSGTDERAIERRLDQAFGRDRPTAGRLAGRSFAPHRAPTNPGQAISEAERLLQRVPPDSLSRDRLAAYLGLATGAWERAAARMERAVRNAPDDPILSNDLGVIYLELATEDRAYLLDAFHLFSRAAELDSSLAAPRFNLVLTYARLHLDQAAREVEQTYLQLDEETRSPWRAELEEALAETPSTGLDQALESGDIERAHALVAKDRDALWQYLASHAMGRSDDPWPQPGVLAFLLDAANQVEQTTGDPTARMIVEPLVGADAGRARTLRHSIAVALGAYQTRGIGEVLDLLESARAAAGSFPSQFDRLWFTLNEAETLAWAGDLTRAEQLLGEVIMNAREHGLKWILADALTRYSDQRYPQTRATLLGRLEEAIRLYEGVGADSSSIRTRMTLAVHAMREGSSRMAFRLAEEALDRMGANDPTGFRNLIWILSQNPLLGARLERAYLTAAVGLAESTAAPGAIAEAQVRLAELDVERGENESADRHLVAAAEATSQLAPEARIYSALANTLTESRILRSRGQNDDAERILVDGLELPPAESTGYGAMFHLELADLYAERGQDAAARLEFGMGLDAIERENNLLGAQSRLAFDERRRAAYESAIRFEYSRGEADTAWQIAQRYRRTLWADSFDRPDAARMNASAVELTVPPAGALVEFTVLEDQVLVWVRTQGGFHVKAVPIPRSELESRVREMDRLLREKDTTPGLEEISRSLYDLLIGPAESLIRNASWIAIVPDRMLNYLPFAALIDPEGRYLIQSFEVVATPEPDYFFDATVPPTLSSPVIFGSSAGDRGTAAEIDGIAHLYPDARIIDGYDATRDAFLRQIAGAGLFVYAGHSALDSTGALSSAILLGGTQRGESAVTALEIADQSLRPNALVVLSSCDSAVGNGIGGAEFRGLTSAFLVAGAGSVVGSLWPVESEETARLMLDFHESLTGRAPAAALAHAQRRMIKQGTHPFYWAAFTVTGNLTSLDAASPARRSL